MSKYNPFAPIYTNNRKESKGRAYHKQYIPLYTTDKKKRAELIAQWHEEGISSIEIERRLRQKRVILHENVILS